MILSDVAHYYNSLVSLHISERVEVGNGFHAAFQDGATPSCIALVNKLLFLMRYSLEVFVRLVRV